MSHQAVAATATIPSSPIEIPPGESLRGSPEDEEGRYDNETLHPVRITDTFKTGKCEVTQKPWREVMGMTIQQQCDEAQDRLTLGERFKDQGRRLKDDTPLASGVILEHGLWLTLKWLAVGEERWLLNGEGDDYPMYYVSWEDATEFCRRGGQPVRPCYWLQLGRPWRRLEPPVPALPLDLAVPAFGTVAVTALATASSSPRSGLGNSRRPPECRARRQVSDLPCVAIPRGRPDPSRTNASNQWRAAARPLNLPC